MNKISWCNIFKHLLLPIFYCFQVLVCQLFDFIHIQGQQKSLQITPENIEKSLSIVQKFLDSTTPDKVKEVEEKNQYRWVTLKPFVALLDCIHYEVFLLGLFSLANLTAKGLMEEAETDCAAENVEILEQTDNLMDKVLSYRWCPLAQSHDYITTISKNLQYKIPSLQSIIEQKQNSQYALYEQQIHARNMQELDTE